MCGTCGCGRDEAGHGPTVAEAHETVHGPTVAEAHGAGHGPAAAGAHGAVHEAEARRVAVERSILEENDRRARALRERLAARGVEAIGLLGSPGSGKTALLEATLARLGSAAAREAVVEGDCATDLDARRIAARGARVAQIATGAVCHLDAHRVEHALEALDLGGVARLWIENVGNLVCPAPFACGESRRAVLVSVPEGDDKPRKYPAMFASADLLVVTKVDLLPHVAFDVERCVEAARAVRPGLPWVAVSAHRGEGLDRWLAWAGGEAG